MARNNNSKNEIQSEKMHADTPREYSSNTAMEYMRHRSHIL